MASSNIPTPVFEDLLPPFLAHIPVAFSSPKAPPSLLPLLAPILRSRVRLLSGGNTDGTINSPSDSWISLLTWSSFNAEPLCESLATQDFSPHPSGEFEIGEYEVRGMQRLDEETMKTCVVLQDRDIDVTYLWVDEKEDKDEGAGWKIVDVNLSSQRKEGEAEWYPTVVAAEKAFESKTKKENTKPTATAASISTPTTTTTTTTTAPTAAQNLLSASYPYLAPPSQTQNDEDDDDYWDMYDRSPARTPAVQHHGMKLPTEDEYFARYSTVSPALDRGDEDPADSVPSYVPPPLQTLQQFQHLQTLPRPPAQSTIPSAPISPPHSTPSKSKPSSLASESPSFAPSASPPQEQQQLSLPQKEPGPSSTSATVYSSPRPTSPQSIVIQQLEEKVNAQQQAEVAVKQHISTSLKSLYRLAKVSGIDRQEFERIVETELALIGVVEEEEEGPSGGW